MAVPLWRARAPVRCVFETRVLCFRFRSRSTCTQVHSETGEMKDRISVQCHGASADPDNLFRCATPPTQFVLRPGCCPCQRRGTGGGHDMTPASV